MQVNIQLHVQLIPIPDVHKTYAGIGLVNRYCYTFLPVNKNDTQTVEYVL